MSAETGPTAVLRAASCLRSVPRFSTPQGLRRSDASTFHQGRSERVRIDMTTQNHPSTPVESGYVPVNGLEMYYEIHGSGRPLAPPVPLVLLHGNLSTIGTSFGKVLPMLASTRRIIAVEQQGHGHTADIDRPLSLE